MSVAFLSVVSLAALVALSVVLNHCQARLALIELTLNEGLPPGHDPAAAAAPGSGSAAQLLRGEHEEGLDAGVHVFLSRNCHACMRLVEEFAHAQVELAAPVHLRHVDRPRPIAASAAERVGASLHDHQRDLADRVGADPLPYTVAIGPHGLVSRAVTPTIGQIVLAARDAGIAARTGVTASRATTDTAES